jgi:hypothetical protein
MQWFFIAPHRGTRVAKLTHAAVKKVREPRHLAAAAGAILSGSIRGQNQQQAKRGAGQICSNSLGKASHSVTVASY